MLTGADTLERSIDKKLVAETAGAVAVVLSLVFVGIELRQANDIATRDVRIQLSTQVSDLERLATDNPEHAALLSQLTSPGVSLSAVEYEQARSYAQQLISHWAAVSAANESGFLPEGSFDAYLQHMASILTRYPALAPIVRERLSGWGIGPDFSQMYRHIYEQIERVELPAA
jgi:hypothetical protein